MAAWIKRHPVLIAALVFAALIALADILFPPPLEKLRNVSPLVLDRHGQWLHGFTTKEGRWRFAADLEAIDPNFVDRLILIEDKRFRSHWGVDPAAVLRAGMMSARSGRIVSGASTITMQTARLLEPRPRTLPSKLAEMIRALQIERRLTKDEILELYLTLAPYGGNIEGVRAASLTYFDKEPVRLTNSQQALLIALPQAPEGRRPDLRPVKAHAARAEILEKLAKAGALTKALADEASDASLPSARASFPRYAYHAAYGLAQTEASEHENGIVHSTLDRSLQAEAEALLEAYAEGFEDKANASLLIIENETRAVRAAVGSRGLKTKGGWIDLTTAARSPGSTLKPFIYAFAFEDGLLSPGSVVDDMPRSFGDYAPENFDRKFRGEVRVREALQHSLNVPAVTALDRVGAARFSALLKAAGVTLRTPKSADQKPGLALALGGAGVTARELAALYAGLASGGDVKPLVWREDALSAGASSYKLFSEETAQRVSAILADAPSLEGRAPAKLSTQAQRVAFKTGTSYGYRDAWAAGHGGGYTIVAWIGHADGAPRPGATGRKAAAPLLFEAFDLLARQGEPLPQDIDNVEEPSPASKLVRLERNDTPMPPEIIFPRPGVEVFMDNTDRGFALAARGGAKDYQWYVDGAPLIREETSGRAVWRPVRAGFYDIMVVDRMGRRAKTKVRVHQIG